MRLMRHRHSLAWADMMLERILVFFDFYMKNNEKMENNKNFVEILPYGLLEYSP